MLAKTILLSFLSFISPLAVTGGVQPPVADSLAVELEEVTVKASPVIRKADRDVYMPSTVVKEKATGGLSLLNDMQLPGVGGNSFAKTGSVHGQTPEFRINNRRTTVEKVIALDARNIARVELITNPGVRYGDVPAVINIIVRNPESGGYASLGGEQALSRINVGNYNGSLSINRGFSQFEMSGFLNFRKSLKAMRVYNESFVMPGDERTDREMTDTVGRGGRLRANISAAYSYSLPGKTNLYLSAGLRRQFDKAYYEGRIKTADNVTGYNDDSFTPQTSPTIHFYFDQNIGRRQTLVFDADASVGIGKSIRTNHEMPSAHHQPELTIDNRINSRNAGVALEAMYIREWNDATFTAGVNYRLSRHREEYLTNAATTYHQRADRPTAFAEYRRRIGPVALTGGLSGSYLRNHYVENDRTVADLLVTPDFSIAWEINRSSGLRFNYRSYSTSPTLTESSAMLQPIDGFQNQIGNPGLKSYNTYVASLTYSLTAPRLSGSLSAEWRRAPGAIMEYCDYGSDGKILNTWGNSSGYTHYLIGLFPRIVVVPGFLTINGMVGYRHFRNHGQNYLSRSNALYAEVSARFTYKDFSFEAYAKKSGKELSGQTIERNEDFNSCMASYRYRHCTFRAYLLHPIGRYRGLEREKRSDIVHSKVRNHFNVENTVMLSMVYNIDWGRRKERLNRKANNSSETGSTQAAGK